MRYAAMSLFALALALALSLPQSRTSAVEVSAGAEVNVGAEVDVGYFHDQLASYGKWVDVANYGRVWQPSVALTVADWRPYYNEGHWVYTDAGWYWESSYPWGWAAFHYGRWNYDDRYKWVWIPDVTWAPSWVVWRQSDTYYGWAPLPFGARFEAGAFVGADLSLSADVFTFVPAASFLSVNLTSVAAPRTQVTNIYKQTTIVNNAYNTSSGGVVNQGIPVKQVASATKQEVKPLQITEAKSPKEMGQSGSKLAAYRPKFKGAAANNATKANEGQVPAGHTTREPLDTKATQPDQKNVQPDQKNVQPDQKNAQPDYNRGQPDQNVNQPEQKNAPTAPNESKATDERRMKESELEQKKADVENKANTEEKRGQQSIQDLKDRSKKIIDGR